MFARWTPDGARDPFPGVTFKTLVHGANTLLTEFHLKGGHTLPRHSHPHEQTGYLVSGALRLRVGDRVFEARPGDAWCIPGNVEHEAQVLEDSVAVEVFAPVRKEYL
ncbi:MAG TPA: cupin domain-containing protein [Candidatus Didemnitutus sp.]|nr:cupin domain-containing protein [Candidatus Didemnitutus sp.]